MPLKPPAIVIAAGGDGKRIGGGKPGRMLAGRSLLEHTISWAQAQSDHVALAVREMGALPPTGLPVLIDRNPDIGPISALDSAFGFGAAQGYSHILLAGCDQPFLPPDMLHLLWARIGSNGAAVPVSLGRHQPMATLWRIDQAALDWFIADGGRSLWRFAAAVGMIEAEWPADGSADPFFNINDAEALAEAEVRVRAQAP